ncbi:U3 snoRNP protein [Cryomyces antarcticus]|uniref:U3 small nucleolar RNA-associated protein 22 n=1 Tax=Cryomyces antarcticus TaxID=329879 RepID=A0ABR0LZK8_9PEZI|nr:U3 snoRNP protein [Cryomyces antarcticus]
MPPPATKKRKVQHVANVEENNDVSSFASFEDTENGEDSASANGSDETNDGGTAVGEAGESAKPKDKSPVDGQDGVQAQEDYTVRGQGTNGLHATKRRTTAMEDGAYLGEVYKSSMFKLQVDELLDQIRPKYGKKEAPAEAALRTLKSIIERIPDREPLPVSEAERDLIKAKRVVVPFPDPPPAQDVKYKLAYARPTNINAVGSYPLKIATRTTVDLVVDLAVTMPGSIFQEKDYLNYRYFYKRAYYLACLAAGIKESRENVFRVSFDCLNGNHLQPIIVVEPDGGIDTNSLSQSKWKIHIILATPENAFPEDKTRPDRNCVRSKSNDEALPSQHLPPTPFYNATLRADSQVTQYLTLLHKAASTCESYRDACVLGRVWLRQRGISGRVRDGGFGNFEWATVMALLLQSSGKAGVPSLSPGYSSYQLFKATLQFLASRNLVKQPLFFQADAFDRPKGDGLPVFFDGPRSVDFLYKMTPWSYRLLRQEARTAVAMLGDCLFDQFESTFILRADAPLQRFDIVGEIPLSAIVASSGTSCHDGSHELKIQQGCQQLYTTLFRGLGDRVKNVSLIMPEEQSWALSSPRPTFGSESRLTVGFVVNPETVARAVDHGPPAESKKEAASFRKFWGEKAELRRFRDGSILESVVWSDKDTGPSIFEQIVRYLLNEHLGKDLGNNPMFVGDQFGRLIPGQPGLAPFQPVMEAFKTLENDIRGMEGLPLTVRSISAANSQLRYASIQVPLSSALTKMQEPADVVIQFEGSGRWPDDLTAIQRTKMAFLLKLAALFEDTNNAMTARLGLENERVDILNQCFLDVVYSSGTAFRLRIRHDREQTLLEQRLKGKTADPKGKEEAALALAAHKGNFLRLPTHTQAMQTLSTRYPTLSPTVRLVKKWFASHLLASHFPDPLIELFVLRVFVQPYPWSVPSSVMTGFLRTLFFLSRWDWRGDPLIVDMSGEMTAAELSAITTRFEAWRRIDPALNRVVLFVASNIDPDGTTWTDNKPAKVVAARMTALARAACRTVNDQGLHVDAAGLLVSPLADYDFVIHLTPSFTGRGQRKKGKNTGVRFKNLQTSEANDVNLMGYSPVELFVEEMKELYGQTMVLFYDPHDRAVIAGLWSPHTARRAWKVNLAYSSIPRKNHTAADAHGDGDGGIDVDINKEAILAEMARLGGDMVSRIEVNRS